MRKFIMAIGLAGIVLLSACGSIPASNEVLAAMPTSDVSSPWTEPIQAPPLEERLVDFPEFLSVVGTISDVEEVGGNVSLVRIFWNEVIGSGDAVAVLPSHIYLYVDQDTVVLADSDIEAGMFVTAVYRAPTREQQLSPGLTLPAVAISERVIRVARYNENWMYNNIQLTITEDTEIIFQDGMPFDGEIDELQGRALVTILGLSGSPVPGAEDPVHVQWPSKVVVLFEQAVPPIHHLTEDELASIPSVQGRVRFAYDVPSSWALEQVSAAMRMGFVPEHLENNFTQAITRAEFAALAVTLYESLKGEITGRTTFVDTNDANVEKVAYLGVVSGVGGNRFDPNGTLTREQAAVILARLINAIPQLLPQVTLTPEYLTNSDISSWAVQSVHSLRAAGIMSGVSDDSFAWFAPQAHFTREQSIVTIMRVFEFVGNDAVDTPSAPQEADPADYTTMTVDNVTANSVTITIQNDSNLPLMTGHDFSLEVYDNGQWRLVPNLDLFFIGEGLPIDPHESLVLTKNLQTFLPLESGIYRIRKGVFIDTWRTDELANGWPRRTPIDTAFDLMAEFNWE